MSDKSNKNEISQKKLEAYLLYGQSLELIKLYNQEFGENFLEKEKFFLVDKKWLDNYKINLEFNLIKETILSLCPFIVIVFIVFS